ncbi:hypothetical protein LNKW23_11680 [Paralimibaculum aggregatum]|uniref:Lipid A biosynthesis lauroyl acyltransferase n=1 Tax=Paralimibaculum aggregatum TaxID=3036245 RepID=A0ABQ6LNX0_9RHOB|nr:hypothetical protein [Limibaculum sp. NKW23]GMG81955.1 hypothetical protein LNKW23_11680 [Limibaculum sp. NKW23]
MATETARPETRAAAPLPGDEEHQPFAALSDIPAAGAEAVAALAARLTTPAAGERLNRWLARTTLRLQPGKRRRAMETYRAIIGDAPGMPAPETYAEDLLTVHFSQQLATNRLGHDPAWRPEITVAPEGVAAMASAQARGQGCVWWWLPQEHLEWLGRVVAHDLGLDYHHISHRLHGPSPTKLGVALLNRRTWAMEGRFSRRIVLGRESARPALAEARRVLEAGGVVGFRGLGRGRSARAYPFFGGHIWVAMGAPVTAIRAGAALFTIAARVEPGERFHVEIRPMAYDPEAGPEPLAAEFARRHEAATRACPALWSALRRQCRPGPPPEGPPPPTV